MLKIEEIRRFIEEDATSERKRNARIGQRYYDGDHDILGYRLFYYNADGNLEEDRARTNAKIPHPFFTELTDQLTAYILSFEENPIRAYESAGQLQDYLDSYFDSEFWSEMHDVISGAYIKGFDYMYVYKHESDRLAFQWADGAGVIEVRANDTDDGCAYVIYWFVDRIDKGKKEVKRIQVFTPDEIYHYVQIDNGEIVLDDAQEVNPQPNYVWTENGVKWFSGLGFIPFKRLDYDRYQNSGLKPIKALIDDYDLMECGLSNNIQDFDTPLIVVDGYQGDNLDELQQNLKTKKIVGVDGGDITYKTIDIPYEARKIKVAEDEKNIYRFGMGLNTAMVGDGNITNVVIKSRYTLLDLKAQKFTMRIERFLKDIVKLVLDEINEINGTDYTYDDIYFDFKRIVPTNEAESAQIAQVEAQTEQIRIGSILNVAAVIGDEETLKAVCDVLELDFAELKPLLEEQREVQNLLTAEADLNGVVTNDKPTENSTTTVFE